MGHNLISLPPENYPETEDYGARVLQAKKLIKEIDLAFLGADLESASRLSGDLFQTAYHLLQLSAQLMIERNNREIKRGNPAFPTYDERKKRRDSYNTQEKTNGETSGKQEQKERETNVSYRENSSGSNSNSSARFTRPNNNRSEDSSVRGKTIYEGITPGSPIGDRSE